VVASISVRSWTPLAGGGLSAAESGVFLKRMSQKPPVHYHMRGRGSLTPLSADLLNEIAGWLVGPGTAPPIGPDLCLHCGMLISESMPHYACYIWHDYGGAFPLFANSAAVFFPKPAHAMLFISQRCEILGWRSYEVYYGLPHEPIPRHIAGTAASIRARNYPTPQAIAAYESYSRADIMKYEKIYRSEDICFISDQLAELGFCLGCRGYAVDCRCGNLRC
jgi:hypothetical protein